MITLVSSPGANNYVNSRIEFTLSMTDVNTESASRAFGYRLISTIGGDAAITPDLIYYPTEAENFTIRFEKDIYNALKTPLPNLTGTHGSFSVVAAFGTYKLQYWEIVFNKPYDVLGPIPEEMCTVTLTDPTTTSTFNVLNAAFDYKDAENNLPATYLMTRKPRYSEIFRDSEDFIYLYRSTSVTVDVVAKVYDYLGIELATYNTSVGSGTGVTKISIVPKNYHVDTEYVTVNYSIGIKTFTHSFRLVDECCDSVQLYYLTKGGGYSLMCGTLLETGHSSASEKVYRNFNVYNQGTGGIMLGNKTSKTKE
jgi:hypothetical protein